MQFLYRESVQLNQDDILKQHVFLDAYRQQLHEVAGNTNYMAAESSLHLPYDTDYANRIASLAQKFEHPNLETVIVIGIGGSSLGTKAIYDALVGCADTVVPTQKPRIIFLETIDDSVLSQVHTMLSAYSGNPEKYLINIISKSGLTTESLFNFERVTQGLDIEKMSECVVVTTDEGSPLWNKAEEYSFHRLAIPRPVGGRYSVLSAVGQFPLQLVGIDVHTLLEGARAAIEAGLRDTLAENCAFISAAAISLHYQKDIRIHDLFLFSPRLESLGKWYRQLLGESIGKRSLEDKPVGVTPTVSVGTTDLHSVAQLYIGGPRDRFTTFVQANETYNETLENLSIGSLVPELRDTGAGEVLTAMYDATKMMYREATRPYVEIVLQGVSEYELGFFLQTKMLEMMYLGKLLNVNAFNQPDVEGYKVETRKILKEGRN